MEKTKSVSAAIECGDTQSALELLGQHAGLADSRLENGVSLLLYSMYFRNQEIAREIRSKKKQPLDLFESSACGEVKTVRQILLNSPDAVSETSSDGFSPLHLAAFFDQPAIARMLLGFGADIDLSAQNSQQVSPIHSAVACQSVPMVRILTGNGANVNAQQHGGFTPLHSAAKHGDSVMVDLLLLHGANVSLKSDDGKTAFDFAAESDHDHLRDRLLPE